jgi:uncharacterized protein YeaO (DUF488 family)
MAAKKRSTIPTPRFLVKRVYTPAEKSDGLRVLVDRLWPRGIVKEKARIDLWLKDLAPSDALRRRVHGDPKQWENLVIEYRHELAREPALSAVANLHDRTTRTRADSAACPLLVEADIRAIRGHSGFDPNRSLAGQNCCAAQRTGFCARLRSSAQGGLR